MKMRKSGLTVILLLILQSAFSTTYYVSLNGVDATGDGSSGRPWRTLRYAVTKVGANQGHIIKLSSGTFIESGLIEVPLGVTIDGAGKDVTILKSASGFFYYPATPGFALDKFLISLSAASPQNGSQALKNFTVDGDLKKLHGGIYVRNRNNVVIENVKVTNTNFAGVWLWDVKDSRVTNLNLLNCAWGSSGWVSGALNIGNAERLEIENSRIDEGRGYGIKMLGPSIATLNNLKIHDCHITVHPVGLWNNGSAPNISIELMQTYMTNCEIYNSYIDNHISLANNETILSNGVKTMRVHHNTFDLATRAQGNGYGLELSIHDVEIDNNYFIKGSYGIVNWGKQKKNWNIHHNVFYGMESSYPADVLRSQQSGFNNLKFFNNTVEFVGGRTANLIGVYGGTSANVEIKNNLIINNNTAYNYYPNRFIHLEAGLSISNLQVANNFLDRIAISTIAGQYSGNLSGDPQISKSGSRPFPYYTPLSGSRLIDGGVNIGLSFVGAKPDIGASESAGTTSTNKTPTVALVSPVNNASFNEGVSLAMSATANDSDGSVSKVEFYNGSTLLGTDTSSPYAFTWSNLPAGNHSLKAIATDNDGGKGTSASVTIAVNASPTSTTAINLPGVVQCEDYSTMSGIKLETTNDTGGGQNVGYIEYGDWMDYAVNVITAGTYQVQYRVASPNSSGSIQLKSGSTTLATTSVTSTGSWQLFTTVTTTANLPSGKQTLRLYAATGGFNINWIQFNSSAATAALSVPGTLQAEAYSQMFGIQKENCLDTGGGQDIGWTDVGDWMDYKVNVTKAGAYTVNYRVASPYTVGKIQMKIGSSILATTSVPATGGWQSWKNVSASVNLPAGVQTIRLYVATGAFNLNWFQFISDATTIAGLNVLEVSESSGLEPFTPKRIFSPNNDGINDTWQWSGDAEAGKVTIYNANGKNIYESTSPQIDWDGASGGQLVAPGAYYYIIEFNGKQKTGALQIVK